MARGAWALALIVAMGCGGGSPFRAVERAIRREIPGRIGPAERYDVRVSRSGARLVAGEIPWVEIHGVNVRTSDALTIRDLRVRLEGVRFDRTTHTLQSVADSRFEAGIDAAAITAFVRARGPRLRDVRVRFRGGQVVVDASPTLLGFGVPVEVAGRPALRDGERIDFDASRVAVLRVGLPELAVQRLEAAINPLVDVRGLRLPMRVREVRVEADRVVIAGTAVFGG